MSSAADSRPFDPLFAGGAPSRNIELKVRLPDPQAARQVAERLATARLGEQVQVDTYFLVPRGRLKLREIDGQSAQLVWYDRADVSGPKPSDYRLVPVTHPLTLKQALRAALGVRAVVEKRRTVFLVDHVRIHLDEVAGLGSFLEFESVLAPGVTEAAGYAALHRLLGEFGIAAGEGLSGSYADLLGGHSATA